MLDLGTSPIEIAKYLHMLWKVIQFFKKGARAEFAGYIQTYEDFLTEAKVLEQHAEEDQYIQDRLLKTQTLLHQFFCGIKEFLPYLGEPRKRNKKFLRRIVAKVQWVGQARKLEELQKNLKQQLKHLTRLRILTTGTLRSTDRIRIRINPFSLGSPSIPQKPDLGGHFVFEAACRKKYKILFYEISSLEHLHEWLLRLFQRHAGRKFIKNMSYVLRNTDTGGYILPSSPCARPFRDIISANHHVEMSIVIPYDNVSGREDKCPKCKTKRKARQRHRWEVTCSSCGLCIQFLAAPSTQPDPLTKVALDDIRAKGIGTFFESQGAPVQTEHTSVDMERWLESKVVGTRADLEPFPRSMQNREAPNPWVFQRVVVCNTQWPDDASWSNIEKAERLLSDTMNTLKHWIKEIDAGHDLIYVRVARCIGVMDWDGVDGDEDLMRCAADLYSSRQPHPKSTIASLRRLNIERSSDKHLLPALVLLRCFSWLHFDTLALETNILYACSTSLNACTPLRGFPRISAAGKAFSVLFIPHMIGWRCSFSLVEDIVDAFTIRQPRLIPPAICLLIKRSQDLCFQYRMKGDLSQFKLSLFPRYYFKETLVTGSSDKVEWLKAYRHCLECIMETEGLAMTLSSDIRRVHLI